MRDSEVQFDVRWQCLAKVGAAFFLYWLVCKTAPIVLVAFLGMMLAVTLNPVVNWLVARRIPKWLAVSFIAVLVSAIFVVAAMTLVPPLVDQFSDLPSKWPEWREQLFHYLPNDSRVQKFFRDYFDRALMREPSSVVAQVVGGLTWAMSGVWEIGVCLVFAIYFLVDGPRAYEWFVAFFSDEQRSKLKETKKGVSDVIFAYIVGQLITSLLCFGFTYLVLALIGVPAALLLAVMAGVFDVLPIVGIFMFAIPAIIMALIVSPTAALEVAGALLVYHFIEAYWIVPLVYGNKLRVSGLAVLAGLFVGAEIGRVEGALAVLPIIASYPIFERIWLAKIVGGTVIKKHDKLGADD